MAKINLPAKVEALLAELGLPWELRKGGHHLKLVVNGRFVGVLPSKGDDGGTKHEGNNMASQIRRLAAGHPTNRRGDPLTR